MIKFKPELAGSLMRSCKRFLFQRGRMPEGDSRDMLDRLRRRFDEIIGPMKRHWPPTSTVLSGAPSPAAEWQRKALRREADVRFAKAFAEEAEAQWDRIIDRRTTSWFYSVVIGGVVSLVIGIIV